MTDNIRLEAKVWETVTPLSSNLIGYKYTVHDLYYDIDSDELVSSGYFGANTVEEAIKKVAARSKTYGGVYIAKVELPDGTVKYV